MLAQKDKVIWNVRKHQSRLSVLFLFSRVLCCFISNNSYLPCSLLIIWEEKQHAHPQPEDCRWVLRRLRCFTWLRKTEAPCNPVVLEVFLHFGYKISHCCLKEGLLVCLHGILFIDLNSPVKHLSHWGLQSCISTSMALMKKYVWVKDRSLQ